MTYRKDDDSTATNAKPQTIADDDLEQVAGGRLIDELNGKFGTHYLVDGQIARKAIVAERSGSGSVHHGGQPPAGDTYTFEEDLGDQIIPVTYKLID